MAEFLHTMVRITDPEKSRQFYEALGFEFERDMDIVRNGELEATNYFYFGLKVLLQRHGFAARQGK
jgi:catechol 2,3-dioxygenase-like lactoylglutathione lyase family enzyme